MSDSVFKEQRSERTVIEAAPLGEVDLSGSPRGALLLGGISVVLMILGWLAFYFFLFLARGPIG